MTTALIVFASTFLTVFALGMQSLNVNQGHYVAAAATSAAISSGHLWLYKVMPNPSWLDLGGYYVGGIVGITASMWFHRRVRAWWQLRGRAWLAWPGRVYAGAKTSLQIWWDQELQRVNYPDEPQRHCTRCISNRTSACWRVDCPFHGTDTH